jgi:hypothetical protein
VPKLSALLPWLDAHGVVLLAVLAALVAAWKAVPAKTRAAIELRFPRLAGLARFVATVGPDLLGAARIARYQIAAGQPRASIDSGTTYAPPADRAQPGYLRLPGWYRRGLRAAEHAVVAARAGWSIARAKWLVCFALACVLAGCPLPPVDGCTPLDTRCSPEGVPQSCSPSQRWTSGALQRPCAQRAAGSVCCRARSPYGASRELYVCVPQSACLPETTSADAGAEGGDQ